MEPHIYRPELTLVMTHSLLSTAFRNFGPRELSQALGQPLTGLSLRSAINDPNCLNLTWGIFEVGANSASLATLRAKTSQIDLSAAPGDQEEAASRRLVSVRYVRSTQENSLYLPTNIRVLHTDGEIDGESRTSPLNSRDPRQRSSETEGISMHSTNFFIRPDDSLAMVQIGVTTMVQAVHDLPIAIERRRESLLIIGTEDGTHIMRPFVITAPAYIVSDIYRLRRAINHASFKDPKSLIKTTHRKNAMGCRHTN